MPDIAHLWGEDVQTSATGDLLAVNGTDLGTQRVLRRLLTNPGDYIWQPDYGAGLRRFIGQTTNVDAIRAAIRSQIFKESVVARTPEPSIDVSTYPGGAVFVSIQYADATSGATQVVQFAVPAQ